MREAHEGQFSAESRLHRAPQVGFEFHQRLHDAQQILFCDVGHRLLVALPFAVGHLELGRRPLNLGEF